MHRISHFIYLIFLLVLWLAPSAAGSVLQIDSEKQFEFAEKTFAAGDYSMAITEYKRFIEFFPEDKRVEPAMYKIGLSYFNERRFKEAITSFEALIDRFGESDLSITSYFMISDSYSRIKAFGPAISNLANLIAVTENPDVRDEAHYRTGWIYLETATWDKARLSFQKISEGNRNKYFLERLSSELKKSGTISRKDPVLAGVLSVVPGAGYAYCERYRDALIAFLVNGAVFFAAYESFDEDHNALGGILTAVGVGFYAGNFYGAVSSAHKYNRTQAQKFVEDLKKNFRINLSAGREKGVELSFRYRF